MNHVVVKDIKVRTCGARVQNNPNFWKLCEARQDHSSLTSFGKLTVFLLWVA